MKDDECCTMQHCIDERRRVLHHATCTMNHATGACAMLDLSQGERSEKQLAMPYGVLLGIKHGAELRERTAVAKKSVGKHAVDPCTAGSCACSDACTSHQPTLSKQVNGIASGTGPSVEDQMHLRLAPRGTARTLGTLQSPKSVCQRRRQPDQCCVLL